MTETDQYLLALPPTIKAALLEIVRTATDTTPDEKVIVLTALNGVGEALFPRDDGQKPLQVLAAVTDLIGATHRHNEEEEVA